MVIERAFQQENIGFNLTPAARRLLNQFLDDDVIIEPRPSTSCVQCTCNKTHRLLHGPLGFEFKCNGVTRFWDMERKRISITPPPSPEHVPMPPAQKYVIPAKRNFKPMKLNFD